MSTLSLYPWADNRSWALWGMTLAKRLAEMWGREWTHKEARGVRNLVPTWGGYGHLAHRPRSWTSQGHLALSTCSSTLLCLSDFL
jgi:hypothetical protein